jgi:nitrite reductase (NO-forming)
VTTRKFQEPVVRLGVIVASAALTLAACGAEASGDVHPGPGGSDAVAVTARDNSFEPARLELPAGEEIEVEITNEGGTTHDFTVDPIALSTGPIDAGAVATAMLTVPEGETTFVCSIHGGMDGVMVGT